MKTVITMPTICSICKAVGEDQFWADSLVELQELGLMKDGAVISTCTDCYPDRIGDTFYELSSHDEIKRPV